MYSRIKVVRLGLFSYIHHDLLQLQSLLSYYGITDWILTLEEMIVAFDCLMLVVNHADLHY
jgi:hypothetical protein